MSKKKGEPEVKKMLGRVKNHLKMGIVGFPNVGKSSLFNILAGLTVPAENYPFCTIDPTSARVTLPDRRFDWLVKQYKPAKKMNAFLEVVDIAGLIKGASKGEGLGNAFLSNIQGVDGIFHLVRCFEDEDVTHVEGNVDPIRDLQVISEELMEKDIEWITTYKEKIDKEATRVKEKRDEAVIVGKIYKKLVEDREEIRTCEWSNKEIEVLNSMMLLTAKPVIYLVNLSERGFLRQKNKWLAKIKEWVESKKKGDLIIPFSVPFEQNLVHLGPEEAAKYCKEKKTKSMLPRIVQQGFRTLHLINFFTCGPDEVKAWTLHANSKAPQAGAVIHGDFEKFFICAEVMKFADLKELGTESEVKAKGKYKQEGRNYVVQDADIIVFKHGGGGGGKKKK
mmetsp:Transcript_24341/g.27059  ORF Transcript_24341/g.27059 Transcript_24341/m.27059 type:complete len:393 (-) Transcript_24341:127-1305(-)